MALRFSTGLANAMLDSTGLRAAMNDGVIRIYTGAQPLSADDAVQGTLLMEVTVDGGTFVHGSPTNGLALDAAADKAISKAAAETWRGTGLANGTAGWFRFCANPVDSGGSSTTLARIDGTCAKTGGDMVMSSVTIVIGQPNTVDTFTITQNSN